MKTKSLNTLLDLKLKFLGIIYEAYMLLIVQIYIRYVSYTNMSRYVFDTWFEVSVFLVIT